MVMTVITITNAPPSLRGDLTKWMQEISTGVYIGNFSARVREGLWERVTQSVGRGQATLSYSTNNESGYQFKTYNTATQNVSFDGIPLVLVPNKNFEFKQEEVKHGFSKAAKIQASKKYSKPKELFLNSPHVILDIETTGLDYKSNDIIEVAAIKIVDNKRYNFESLVNFNGELDSDIINLTGITSDLLIDKGDELQSVLQKLIDFIEDLPIIGYNIRFDTRFINHNLKSLDMSQLDNKRYDLMQFVKKEKIHLNSYKLENVLLEYGVTGEFVHRAYNNADLTLQLAYKVTKFVDFFNRKH